MPTFTKGFPTTVRSTGRRHGASAGAASNRGSRAVTLAPLTNKQYRTNKAIERDSAMALHVRMRRVKLGIHGAAAWRWLALTTLPTDTCGAPPDSRPPLPMMSILVGGSFERNSLSSAEVKSKLNVQQAGGELSSGSRVSHNNVHSI
ncbi:unnamed protein product [Prorocentrum cordatum]|uniref:BRCT domain-containing protein n=1 Tax=Prorocentrum cordatum TaxID=2364126 RepID=A0ABN9V158_9DINO|nr:unnamed protein product [Polarella glacialis]